VQDANKAIIEVEHFNYAVSQLAQTTMRNIVGEFELDESYFSGKRKGNRGRGAKNKAIVFGILERKGKVHTVIVQDVSADTLMNEIKNKTKKGSVFYTDGWRSYNSLE